MDTSEFKDAYASVLKAFAESREEQYLATAADLGREMVRSAVPPEELPEIHEHAIQQLAEESPNKTLLESVQQISAPLMEMLMAYGLAFRKQQEERKRAEEALRKSEALLTGTGRMAKVGGWEVDAKTLAVSWTEETYRIHEVPLGQKPSLEEAIDFFHPDDRPGLETAIQKALEHGEPYDMEIRFITAKGKHLWTHTVCEPVIVDGKTVQLNGTFQDITERKGAEEEILQLNATLEQRVTERTAEFEAANKELEAFAYSVSHDLRGPLRAIDGFSGILLEEYGDKIDTEGLRLLGVVRENTTLMARLIEDLLELSRVGRQSLAPSRVDMKSLVEVTIETLRQQNPNRDCEFAIGELPPVVCDKLLIGQVWTNLLSNAVKFTGLQEVGSIEITGHVQDGTMVYCVKDNGAGFNMDYAPKLFALFQRLHSPGEFPGTGVGLAIVKRVVELHGGRVWAEGKVDEGAIFYFALPKTEI